MTLRFTQILLIALSLSISTFAYSDTLSGKVTAVSDGDTLTILVDGNKQIKIRLAAIDAPEKNQAFGNRAKQQLSDLCFSKNATLKVVSTDRYGRTVGDVYCAGTNANLEMVKSGLAWVFRKYDKGFEYLYAAEEDARSAKLGLWTDPNPIAPWDWRKSKGN
jgi:endonuclease YncB( thermonuclease family)